MRDLADDIGRLLLLGLLCSIAAPSVRADVVVLTSGNRMTGEVVQLERGLLTFAIAGAGPVDIDWNNVETLESEQRMEVRLASGAVRTGAISSPGPGRLRVAADTDSEPVDAAEVIGILPIGATLAERLTGSIDLGAAVLDANDELDWTLNAEIAHRSTNYLTELSIESLIRESDEETAQKRNYIDLRSRRFLRDRWFVLGLVKLEEDRELDLDSRFLIGPAVGRTLRQSNRSILAAFAGVAYDRERYRSLPGGESTTEALASIEWDWFEVGGDMELTSEATVYFGVNESRRRVEIEAHLRRVITGRLYWSVNFFESHNSDPPEGAEDRDYGFTLTIGADF